MVQPAAKYRYSGTEVPDDAVGERAEKSTLRPEWPVTVL